MDEKEALAYLSIVTGRSGRHLDGTAAAGVNPHAV